MQNLRKIVRNIIKELSNKNFINENENYIYTDSDYERYLSLEQEIVNNLNEILPQDRFFASTWYRRSHVNDKDLIFQEMHFSNRSNLKKIYNGFVNTEKELVKNNIDQILNKYSIKGVKIIFDNKFKGIILKNFKDDKIKKANKGRKSFEYPIDGKKVKFIIADRDLVPFVGVKSLKNIFSYSESLSIDGSYKIVAYLSTNFNRYIKINDDVYNLNDVEKAYVKFFQDTQDIEKQDNVGTKDIMFKKYILNDLKTYNQKDLVDLFDMLETINFDFVYYESVKMSGINYVRNID